MSRTYKDRPQWVKENDPAYRKDSVAQHDCGTRSRYTKWHYEERNYTISWYSFQKTNTYRIRVVDEIELYYVDCDIDAEAHRSSSSYWTDKTCEHVQYGGHRCEVQPEDRKQFHRQVRNERRGVTKKLVDEYNVSGTIEDDYVFTPHRKRATFGGGYFD